MIIRSAIQGLIYVSNWAHGPCTNKTKHHVMCNGSQGIVEWCFNILFSELMLALEAVLHTNTDSEVQPRVKRAENTRL